MPMIAELLKRALLAAAAAAAGVLAEAALRELRRKAQSAK